MKIIEQLREKIESIGGSLDDGDYAIHLDAPSGYVWRANGLPSFTINYATNSQTWLAKAVQEETGAMRMGLEKVMNEKELAEHRWNLGDDDWGAPTDAPATLEWPK